jgi:hypothetical protein
LDVQQLVAPAVRNPAEAPSAHEELAELNLPLT